MRAGGLRRIAALALALAVPLGFYTYGDVVDAFPGVLTITRPDSGPEHGPPAEGEDYEAAPVQGLFAPASAEGEDAGSADDASLGDHDVEGTAEPVDSGLLAEEMASVTQRPVVGQNLAFSVVDAETGEEIASRDSSTARAPASTMKLLTSLTAIRALGPERTFTTSVAVEGESVTLVGEGDMYLSVDGSPTSDGLPRASLSALADETAAYLTAEGVTSVDVRLDDTFFDHDPINPAWGNNGPSGGWVAPIMALGVDGGRLDGTPYGRKSTDPALDATETFADLLRERGIEVRGDAARAGAPDGAATVASVTSAPVSRLIEHTLITSDNTMAETLARASAKELGFPATVQGARDAVTSDLAALAAEEGFDVDGLAVADNSGLSHDNRVSPSFLAHLNAWAAGDAPGPVRDVFAQVPVGGLSGTLTQRFGSDTAADARGIVRGKTGYLGGVSSLSGTAVLADGRLVGYSILVYGFDGTQSSQAKAATDEAAARMVQAGAPAATSPDPAAPGDSSGEADGNDGAAHESTSGGGS